MRYSIIALLALGACTTTSIQTKEPVGQYSSVRSREVVTDCLLNRLSTDMRTGKVSRGASENVVAFGGIAGTLLSFTVRDSGTGSTIEMRRLSAVTPGKTVAETCF